ncbi:MAG: hypothetical protein AAGH15_06865 [Myxococcota bacterium]
MGRLSVLGAATLLLACTGELGNDEAGDAATSLDAGTEDAGRADAGGEDAGRVDAGGNDAGSADAGFDLTVDAGRPLAEFEERDGLVVFEAEHFFAQIRDEWTRWYRFEAGAPDPEVTCRTEVSCGGGGAPDCNEYASCDGDAIDPADASQGIYLEALPDRRRTDDDPGTAGAIGVVNDPDRAPTLIYRVHFTTTGRYYVWVHARGQGPAANGLHVGLDGEWPRNELVDPSSMRLQFRNGWRWTQTRRGGRQHTGVSATDEVSLRDANVWVEIATPGVHTLELGMREDGLEIDKVLLTTDPELEPEGLDQPETRLD